MNKLRRDKKEGFTLIEVLIGMVILSVGLLMLLPMMVVSMQANDFAKGYTEASMIIKEKMEELKNMDNPVSGADTTSGVSRRWTVTDAGNDLKRILVNVSWTDNDGRAHNNSMISYMLLE